MDELPQRTLTYRLKVAIDTARDARPSYQAFASRALLELIRSNRAGVVSSHVRHNLGAGRRAWLDSFMEAVMVRPQDEPVEGQEPLRRDEVPTTTGEVEATLVANDRPDATTFTERPRPAEEFFGQVRGDAVPTKRG